MNFVGTGTQMSLSDKIDAAKLLGCDVAAIEAVIAVETNGRGFDAKHRPKMLFEPHIFFTTLNARRASAAAIGAAVAQNLAYPNQGTHPYPADSYPHLEAACAIDETAALLSASWGLGQIMGFNHNLCGYADASLMVTAACESEGQQLTMMARFILNCGLAPALKNRQWSTFAARYNGPGYDANNYVQKLQTAYAKAGGGTEVASASEMTADDLNAAELRKYRPV